jgi:hypothetical protein
MEWPDGRREYGVGVMVDWVQKAAIEFVCADVAACPEAGRPLVDGPQAGGPYHGSRGCRRHRRAAREQGMSLYRLPCQWAQLRVLDLISRLGRGETAAAMSNVIRPTRSDRGAE